jgi:hypothetical protein
MGVSYKKIYKEPVGNNYRGNDFLSTNILHVAGWKMSNLAHDPRLDHQFVETPRFGDGVR